MLALIRRRRWIAALLIALSPALAGVALPLVHPCPVDSPWMLAGAHRSHEPIAHDAMAHDAMAHDAMAHDAMARGHGSSQHGHQHAVCHCPGGCHLPQLVTPSVAAPVAVPTHARPAAPDWSVVERGGDAVPILEYLPEATAPPLA